MGGPDKKSLSEPPITKSTSKLPPSRPLQQKNKSDRDLPPPPPPKKDTEEAVAEAYFSESEGGEEEVVDLKKGSSKKKAPSKKKEVYQKESLPQINLKPKGQFVNDKAGRFSFQKEEEEDERFPGGLPSIQLQKKQQTVIAPPIVIKELALFKFLDTDKNEFTTELVRKFSVYFLRKNMKERKNFFFNLDAQICS